MPSVLLLPVTITITAASASQLTCASTVGLYVGQKGWAVKSDSTGNVNVIISQIIDSTHFLCQSVSNVNNSGGVDLTAYNGGKIYFELQTVATQNASNVTVSGGTIAGLTSFGIRDTSAGYDLNLVATSSVTATAQHTFTLDSQNQDWTLKPVAQPDKGDLLVGAGGGEVEVLSAGANQSLIEYDSTQPTGLVPVTASTLVARRNAQASISALEIDPTKARSYKQLANGVNAFTIATGGIDGMTSVIQLLQPASGAAGTITLTASGTDTVRVSGALTLSPTNNKANFLILTYDGRSPTAGYFVANVTGEF